MRYLYSLFCTVSGEKLLRHPKTDSVVWSPEPIGNNSFVKKFKNQPNKSIKVYLKEAKGMGTNLLHHLCISPNTSHHISRFINSVIGWFVWNHLTCSMPQRSHRNKCNDATNLLCKSSVFHVILMQLLQLYKLFPSMETLLLCVCAGVCGGTCTDIFVRTILSLQPTEWGQSWLSDPLFMGCFRVKALFYG